MKKNLVIIFLVLFNLFIMPMEEKSFESSMQTDMEESSSEVLMETDTDSDESFVTTTIKEFVCSVLKLENFGDLCLAKFHEVSREYYKKLIQDGRFKVQKIKFVLSEHFKNTTGVIGISLVKSELTRFANIEYVNKVFLKIKYASGKAEFIKTENFGLPKKLDGFTNAIEFKNNDKSTSALVDEQWTESWRSSVDNEKVIGVAEIYSSLEKQILEVLKKEIESRDSSKKFTILEIASGKGDLAYKLLEQTDIDNYMLLEYNEASCLEAREKLKKFGNKVNVIQGDALTYDFHKFTKDKLLPNVVIASGALTTMVFNDAEECRCILKKLIEIMPVEGKIILTGFMPQHVSLAHIQAIYPFKVLQRTDFDLEREFLVLEKRPIFDQDLQINAHDIEKKGTLDLFQALHHPKDMGNYELRPKSLQEILESLSRDIRAKIKHLDLSVCDIHVGQMSALSLLPNLTSLSLAYTKNGDELLKHIPFDVLAKLKFLNLSYTNVSKFILQELVAKTQLEDLRLDLCVNLSLQEQLSFIFQAASRAQNLDLTFLYRRCYRDFIPNIREFLSERKFVATKISIPKSVIDEIMQNKESFIFLKQFLMNKELEIIMDNSKSNILDEDELEEAQKTFLEFKEKEHEIKDSFSLTAKMSANGKSIYKKLKALKHAIPEDKLSSLVQYIEKNKEKLCRDATIEEDKVFHLDKRKSGLCSSVDFFADGDIFIRLKSSRHAIIGKSSSKILKFSLRYPSENHNPELFVLYILDPKQDSMTIIRYKFMHSKFKNSLLSSGSLMPIIKIGKYKSNKEKCLIIVPYYSQSSLDKFVEKKVVTDKDRKVFVEDLFSAIDQLHKVGFVHCDIHMGNLFLSNYRSSLGDFDLILPMKRAYNCGKFNLAILPPEILRAVLSKEKVVIDEKIDIWQIGLLMARLFNVSLKFDEEIDKLVQKEEFNAMMFCDKAKKILSCIESFSFAEPVSKDSIEHLIWQMLRPAPNERISFNDAKQKFDKIKQNICENKLICFNSKGQQSAYSVIRLGSKN